MEAIKLLILVFGLLFIIERKPMNMIFNFIGLIISVAILLGEYNMDYLSYLLIIIYCSALTIIFGFVIMLTPQDNKARISEKSIIIMIPLILILTYLIQNPIGDIEIIRNEIGIVGENSKTLLNKIGELLYLEETNIFKFLIATLILLLALVALFHILIPTF